MRRVVITGMGLVSPVGCGVDHAWSNLLTGKSGARRVTEFDVSDIACQIGCFIPRGSAPGSYKPDDWMEPKEQRKVDEFIVFAMAAAEQALAHAGWKPQTEEEANAQWRFDWFGHRRSARHRARRSDFARERAAPR